MKQLTGYLNIDKVSLTYPDFLMITKNACKNIRERYYEKLDKDTVYTKYMSYQVRKHRKQIY